MFICPFFRSFVRVSPPPLTASLRKKSQPQGSNPSFETQIPASSLKSQPQASNPSLKSHSRGSNPSPETQIPALRPKSGPARSNPSLEVQILASRLKSLAQGSNRSLEAQIPASKLGYFKFQPQCSNQSLHAETQTKHRSLAHMNK